MFTRDDDFLREATRRLRVRESFLGVIYTHQIGLSIGECIQELELIAFATETEEYRNRVEYLPL